MPFRNVAFANFKKCADKPCKDYEEAVSFMEGTAILNAYQKIHNPLLSFPSLSQLCPCFRSSSSDQTHHHLSLVVCFSHDYSILFWFCFNAG